MNRSEAAKTAATLMALYPNHKLGADSEAGYALALVDVPYATITALMQQVMDAHPTFCPGPAELRAFVRKVTQPEPSWELAWGEAFRQVTSVGSWGAPVFADAALADTVRSLGWDAFCHCPIEGAGRTALQTRFREAYQAATERRRNADTLATLPEPTRLAVADRGVAS